jgi:two-component system, OmpR family, sensor histidine kinase KdpD
VVAGVAATTWLVGQVRVNTQIDTPSILYLLVILVAAITFGAGPAIAASVLSVVTYDFFLVEPVGSFGADDIDQILALALFLLVGVVTSGLAAGQRYRTEEAQRREREATALYTLNSLTARSNDPQQFVPDVARAFADSLGLAGLALLIQGADGELEVLVATGEPSALSPDERALALAVFREGRPIGFDPNQRPLRRSPIARSSQQAARDETTSGLPAIFLPVQVATRTVGVLRVRVVDPAEHQTDEERRQLAAIAQQFGQALERARLQSEAAEVVALRRADELKDALVHSVTHDLRTPLALIRASAENLRVGEIEWSPDERASFVSAIEQNVDRLDKIVANLLDLSRLDAGLVQPDRQYFPIGALIDDVLGRLRLLLLDHVIAVDVPDDLPPVPVDYVAIDRVLSNLLENVVRHTPAGTSVTIAVRQVDETVIVTVADNGLGIAPADVSHVFERFYRGGARRSDVRRGAGLGLAVSRGLIEAHGGKIWVESTAGKGTTFGFWLPLVSESTDLPSNL